MPNIFVQPNDVIRMTSSSCNSCNINTINSQTFFFWPKNKRPLTLSKFFPHLLFFPSTKFWSSYIVWLYIKRTKLHTKGLLFFISLFDLYPLWSISPSYAETSLILLQNTHFYTSPSPLQKYLFLEHTITH